ncbi:transformer-2 protein homolog beta-like [Hibiscus syriacus]|uniref:transformer-2 protein homolog beta-like n=1 Tax=Hibiscus syriacus TaxID=106335 RepID=UPI00192171AC|nr:transformer-2 protein homolog beta-like [Hibiscus syriacus]
MSKRTHQATLRDVFSEYGEVVDSFIVYRNQKRVGKNKTFAFVRFKRWLDTVRAVERGDKRKLDGFMIRVFMEKNVERHHNNPRDKKQNGTTRGANVSYVWRKRESLKDTRSFKEAHA